MRLFERSYILASRLYSATARIEQARLARGDAAHWGRYRLIIAI
ncbi:MAG: hypothetical protein ACR65Z_16985 [Methylocystis sp.]